jgi:hypothetical protein
MKRLTFALLLLVMQGCEVESVHRLVWQESVQTSGGEVAEVSRELTFGVSRPLAERQGMVIPSSTKITIRTSARVLPTLDVGPLVAILLAKDVATSDFVVIAGTNRCNVWLRNEEPDPPYWAFRLVESEWFRTDLPQEWIGRPANLLCDIRSDDRGELDRAEVERRKTAQLLVDSLSKSLQSVLVHDPLKKNCGHAIGSDEEQDLKHFRRS